GNDGRTVGTTGRFVHGSKVFRNLVVGVEAVDRIEQRRQSGPLVGQVILGAATEDEDVDFVAKLGHGIQGIDRHILGEGLQIGGITASEDAYQLHIRTACQSQLDAPAKVAVANDADADLVSH